MPESETIRIFLELKNSIGSEMSSSLSPVKGSGGIEFVFFLAALNSIRSDLHSPTSQLTIFHLSECLTVINSYKSPTQRKLLLVKETNNTTSVVSTLDLPCLQVTAVFHILYGIMQSRVTLDSTILADVLGSALRMFLRIVVHALCPSSLKKAYVYLITALLDPKSKVYDQFRGTAFEVDIVGSIGMCLKKYIGETLRDCLILVSPLLPHYTNFSTVFVQALYRLDDQLRVDLIQMGKNDSKVPWDTPFLFEKDCVSITKTWSSYGIMMGVYNHLSTSKKPIDAASLQILSSALHSELQKDIAIEERIPPKAADMIFDKLSEYVIAGLAVPETSTQCWDTLLQFMNLCTGNAIQTVPKPNLEKQYHPRSINLYPHPRKK